LNELRTYLKKQTNLEIDKIEPGIEDCFMRLMIAQPDAITKIESRV